MEQSPIFHPYEISTQDKATLDQSGHLSLPGLLTPDACERLITALGAIQKLQEAKPSHKPEYNRYAAEYNDYLAGLIGHPQMLKLARSVLGNDIRYDHCVTLNRRGGDQGSAWHSHSYGELNKALGFLRIFFYVNGFTRDDANLKVVPGSHLFRDPGIKAITDKDLLQGWMKDKVHPLTGEPLYIEDLETASGSVILMWTHAAHGVTPRKPDSDTRWCVVYAYRNPGEPSRARWVTEEFEKASMPGTEGLMGLY